MRAQIQEIFDQLRCPVEVISGGSHSIGVATAYSDREYYIVAKNWKTLIRILSQKETIEAQKKSAGIEADFLLTTRWLVNHRWYYLLGVDEDGAPLACAYDPILLRNTSLKMGVRAYLDIHETTDPLKQQYLLSKSTIQLLYCQALMTGQVPPGQLFTPQGAVHIAKASPSYAALAEVIALKFSREVVSLDAFLPLWHQLLDDVVSLYRKGPKSWRAYGWNLIFALRYREFRAMMKHMDDEIIEELVCLVSAYSKDAYQDIRPAIVRSIVL